MDWIEISIHADGEAAEAVSELFNRLNSRPDGQGGAVTEMGGFDPVGEDHHPFVVVKTYLPAGEADTPDRQRQIEEGLWFLGRIYPLGEVRIQPLAETDWANAWKASYQPLRIGERFWVVPAWEAPPHPPPSRRGGSAFPPAAAGGTEGGLLPIILDPGMAFGTGLHPSTQLCLCLMEDVVGPGQRVLDAGCGSGILSIAAVRLGATQVDAFDIDPIAVTATRENAALNDLPIPIHVVVSAGPDEHWTRTSADDADALSGKRRPLFAAAQPDARPSWDVILVNILPHVIEMLLDAGLQAYLAPGGRMILAGIIEEREADVCAALARHELTVYQRLLQGDWVGLVAAQDVTP